jgi:hypothetical protein
MAETAYKVAWLKRYYAPEFYCALNEQPMGFYSEEVICNDARRHGIEVRGRRQPQPGGGTIEEAALELRLPDLPTWGTGTLGCCL